MTDSPSLPARRRGIPLRVRRLVVALCARTAAVVVPATDFAADHHCGFWDNVTDD